MPEKVRALVVDDSDDMRMLLRVYIEQSDHAIEVVSEASDGPEAIERWRADHPDVIVLDVSMPTMNGIDVARAILGELPTQAIVLFSAYLDAAVIAEAQRLGVRDWVEKDQLRRLPDVVAAVAFGDR